MQEGLPTSHLNTRRGTISRSVDGPDAPFANDSIVIGDSQPAHRLARCAECKSSSGPFWMQWRACRTDVPGIDEEPALALFCPDCANREFGPLRLRPLVDRRRAPRPADDETE